MSAPIPEQSKGGNCSRPKAQSRNNAQADFRFQERVVKYLHDYYVFDLKKKFVRMSFK